MGGCWVVGDEEGAGGCVGLVVGFAWTSGLDGEREGRVIGTGGWSGGSKWREEAHTLATLEKRLGGHRASSTLTYLTAQAPSTCGESVSIVQSRSSKPAGRARAVIRTASWILCSLD